MAVDEAHGVISHVQADFADQRDCTLLPSIVTPLHQRLTTQGLPLREIAADTNYSNGVNYALLEAQGLTPWIPVFGKYKPQIEGFAYDKEADCFTCPASKRLPFKCFRPRRPTLQALQCFYERLPALLAQTHLCSEE